MSDANARDPAARPEAAELAAPVARLSTDPAIAAGGAAVPIPPRVADQPEGILERIEKAVENLVVLRVTTVVGTVNARGADDFDQVTGLTLAQGDQQVCSTSINMLLGDCSLILSQVFVDNAAYKQLHADAVTQAKEVRQQTITLLKEAFDAFKDKLFH